MLDPWRVHFNVPKNSQPALVNYQTANHLKKDSITTSQQTHGRIPERAIYTVYNDAESGTFKLQLTIGTVKTSGNIKHDANASIGGSSVKSILKKIAGINDVEVEGKGTPDRPWKITFNDPYHGVTNITADDTMLRVAGGFFKYENTNRPGGVTLINGTLINGTQKIIPYPEALEGKFKLAFEGQKTGKITLTDNDHNTVAGLIKTELNKLKRLTERKLEVETVAWVAAVNPMAFT